MEMSLEIIFNPAEKLITFYIESPERGKISSKASIESINCNLNAGLTEGYSLYRALTLEKDRNLESVEVSFRIEAKENGLEIVMINERQKRPFIIKVDRWEVVK